MRGMLFLFAALLAPAQTFRVHTLPFTLANGESARKYLPGTMAGGLAVLDIDNDGLPDLVFANGAALPSLRKSGPTHYHRLLRNLGNFRFADITENSGILQEGYGTGAASGDVDGDGRPDFLLTGVGFVHLYRNLGQNKFALTRLPTRNAWTYTAALADLDSDHDLDLILVNYVAWSAAQDPPCKVNNVPDYCHPRYYPAQPNQLWENDSRGNFRDVTAASGLAKHPGKGMGIALADFNADQRLDFFITNDRELNFLFLNRGNLRFEESAFLWGVAAPADGKSPSAMGAAAFDFNHDSRPDLIYTALREETFPVYRNTGKDFIDAGRETNLAPLTRPMSGWAVLAQDFNNDGRPDLFFARSDALSPQASKGDSAKEPLTLLLQNAQGKYEAAPPIDAPPNMYRWAVAADFNNDGCLDIAVTALNSPALLLENLSCAKP